MNEWMNEFQIANCNICLSKHETPFVKWRASKEEVKNNQCQKYLSMSTLNFFFDPSVCDSLILNKIWFTAEDLDKARGGEWLLLCGGGGYFPCSWGN